MPRGAALMFGLGGLFGGAAQGYNAYLDRVMRQTMQNAELAQMGATSGPPGMSGDQAGQVLGGVNQTPLSDVGASLNGPVGGVPAPTTGATPAPDLSGGPSAPAAPPPPGVSPPTDQATQIKMDRAARAMAAAQKSHAHLLPGVNVASRPAAAALSATMAPTTPLAQPAGTHAGDATSGTGEPPPPTGGVGAPPVSPTAQGGSPTDVVGNPFFAQALQLMQQGSKPQGYNEIAKGLYLPNMGSPIAQQRQMAMANILAQAGSAVAQQQQALRMQGNEITAHHQDTAAEIAARLKESSDQLQLEGKRLDAQTSHLMLMTGFAKTKQDQSAVKAMQDDPNVKALTTEARATQGAIEALENAKSNPTEYDPAAMRAFMATAGGSSEISSRIAEFAADSPDKSAGGRIAYALQRLGTGAPSDAIDKLEEGAKTHLATLQPRLQKAWYGAASAHPEYDNARQFADMQLSQYAPPPGAATTAPAAGAGAYGKYLGKTLTVGGKSVSVGQGTIDAANDPKNPKHDAAVKLLSTIQ